MKLLTLLTVLTITAATDAATILTQYNTTISQYNTKDSFGYYKFKLTQESNAPEFQFSWEKDKFSIESTKDPKRGQIQTSNGNVALLDPADEMVLNGKWSTKAEFEDMWHPGTSGNIGLAVGNSHTINYGWVNITWNEDESLTINSSAYETSPNCPPQIPELTAWMLLPMAAPLVLLRHRCR